jgi:hypothetical protein
MARLLHPSYFPATREAPDCEYWGGFDIPLEQKMEAYWRVRKWSINISATFGEDGSTTGASGILDVSQRGNEANLVCPDSVVKELAPLGQMIDASAFIGAVDFHIDGLSFDDVLLFWPDNSLGNLPVTLRIGNYEKITYASLAGIPDPPNSSFGLVEAIEWWPYEDASGQALYNTSTGQPL